MVDEVLTAEQKRAGRLAVESITTAVHEMSVAPGFVDDMAVDLVTFLDALTGIAGGLVELLADATDATADEVLSILGAAYAE